MNTGTVSAILGALVRSLPKDWVREALDKLLDLIETKVHASENKIDDAIILPLCLALRAQLMITEEPGSKFEDKPSNPSVEVNINVESAEKKDE